MTFSDSGAHVSLIMDSSIHTHLLAYWVRERQAFSLEEGVKDDHPRARHGLGLYRSRPAASGLHRRHQHLQSLPPSHPKSPPSKTTYPPAHADSSRNQPASWPPSLAAKWRSRTASIPARWAGSCCGLVRRGFCNRRGWHGRPGEIITRGRYRKAGSGRLTESVWTVCVPIIRRNSDCALRVLASLPEYAAHRQGYVYWRLVNRQKRGCPGFTNTLDPRINVLTAHLPEFSA